MHTCHVHILGELGQNVHVLAGWLSSGCTTFFSFTCNFVELHVRLSANNSSMSPVFLSFWLPDLDAEIVWNPEATTHYVLVQVRAFPTYGQLQVPSCPDTGGLRLPVSFATHLTTSLLSWVGKGNLGLVRSQVKVRTPFLPSRPVSLRKSWLMRVSRPT